MKGILIGYILQNISFRGDSVEKDMKSLLIKAQGGNADAFGEIYSFYALELYRYALKYLGNTYDAEDAVSESALKVFKSVGDIKNPDKLKAYFFKTLSNTARTMLKRNSLKIVEDIDEGLPSSENLEDDAVLRNDLNEALKTLSEEERNIVLLSAVGGFNSKEIAKITDASSGTIRSKLSRALSKLRKELDRNERE